MEPPQERATNYSSSPAGTRVMKLAACRSPPQSNCWLQENLRVILGDAQQFKSRVRGAARSMFPALDDFGTDVEDVSEHSLAGAKSLPDFLDLTRAHGLDTRDFCYAECDRETLLSGDGGAKTFHELVENLDFLWHCQFPFSSATTARRAAFCFSFRSSCWPLSKIVSK